VRNVPFSCFALTDSFSAVTWASGHVFIFCAPGLIFGGAEGVGSRFHVLGAQIHFRRYLGRRVTFSCFARPDSFSAVPRAWGPVFLFCAPGLVFGGIEGVGSRFHVVRSRMSFRRYRGRRVSFSSFARPDSFSRVTRVSRPIFMFCAPRLIFGDTEGVVSHFHVLRSRTLFRRCRSRRVPFSCFARPDSFSAVPSASCLVFMFCAHGHVFGGAKCVMSRFHVLRSRTRFRRYRGSRVSFSCFNLPDSFSAVPKASGPVFMFCEPGFIFGGTEVVGTRFQVLCSRTRFRRCQVRHVPFSCFVRPDSFSAVPWSSGPVFMFCASGLIFGGAMCVMTHYNVA
jgi:hypothetical protein